jgi:predicted dehydrogenase
MINLAIVGNFSAVNRHADALGDIHDIRITGRWVTDSERETAIDVDAGLTCTSPEMIIDNADAIIVAENGAFCSRLIIAALRKARHVFLYPASLDSVNDANQLLKLAREANVILKAGKTGCVNTSMLLQAIPLLSDISMVDLHHYRNISESSPHGISGALLADLEIVSSLIGARIISIKAKGMSMISNEPEIINARLEYDNGCAVNYNCNLVAAQTEFRITLVLKNRILKYDFISGELTNWHVHPLNPHENNPISIESVKIENGDSLPAELNEFITLIRSGQPFLSVNENGFEPFLLTDRIMDRVMKTLVRCT